MRKNYFTKNLVAASMLLAVSMGMASCSGLIDAVLGDVDNPTQSNQTPVNGGSSESPTSKKFSSQIIMNAENPEIFNVKSEDGNVFHFYGSKDEQGGVTLLSTIEQTDNNGETSILTFDSSGKIVSFFSSNNVEIEFDWINDKTAILKVFNPEDNSYIIANWDLNNPGNNATTRSSLRQNFTIVKRVDNIRMEQFADVVVPKHFTRGDNRDYDVFVRKCDSPINAKVSLRLVDYETNEFITNIYDYQYVTQGWYSFNIPNKAFPTKLSHQDLLNRIDQSTWAIRQCLPYMIEGFVSIVPALSFGLAATGVGALPATVIAAVGVLTGMVYGVSQVLAHVNPSDFVKEFAPEYYYQKEYKKLFVIPVVNGKKYIDSGDWISYEDIAINDGYWSSVVNLEGNPSLQSFILNPSHPSAGQNYVATIYYSCIPKNSMIEMSIVGTDNYKNNTTQYVESENGHADLYVPGAAAGVYDFCTAKITDPDGKDIGTLTASLTFGN